MEFFLQLQLYSSWILDNPNASFSDWGFSILAGSLILSFNPLRKQLSLCDEDKPLILLDKTSNWALYIATNDVCLSHVNVSIGSSYAVEPNLTCIAWTNDSPSQNTPISLLSWNHIKSSPSMWNEANITRLTSTLSSFKNETYSFIHVRLAKIKSNWQYEL